MVDICALIADMSNTTTDNSVYGWIIDTDHLFNPELNGPGFSDEAGTVGPWDAVGNTKAKLADHYTNRHQFRMYDDDGELYYTGTLFWNGDSEPSEDILIGPLEDYGMPNAGCTRITYTGKPGWEIG